MLGAIDWGFRVILVTDALCSSADETHDAMMNIYMNRFGEQVETVTTQTLLESWPARGAAAAGMSVRCRDPGHKKQSSCNGRRNSIFADWFAL